MSKQTVARDVQMLFSINCTFYSKKKMFKRILDLISTWFGLWTSLRVGLMAQSGCLVGFYCIYLYM